MSYGKGIKALDLHKCDLCGVGLCKETGLPLFWRISVERMGVKANAVREFEGLSMMLGSAQLAAVMGTDPDIAIPVGECEVLACDACGGKFGMPQMLEGERERRAADLEGAREGEVR